MTARGVAGTAAASLPDGTGTRPGGARWWQTVLPRTVLTVVLLDAVTYVVVYWLLVPVLQPVLDTFNPGLVLGLQHAILALRLGLVGFWSARAFRRTHGLRVRSEVVPSVGVGALLAFVLQWAVGAAVAAAAGLQVAGAGAVVVNGLEWVLFPVLGVLFVQPGPAWDGRSTRRG